MLSKYRAVTQSSASRMPPQTGQVLRKAGVPRTEGSAGRQWAQPIICMILSPLPGNNFEATRSPGPRIDEQRGQERPPDLPGVPGFAFFVRARARRRADKPPISKKTAARRDPATTTAAISSIGPTIAWIALALAPRDDLHSPRWVHYASWRRRSAT